MGSFNIADEVEPLAYDFTTARPLPDALKGAKGIVPEPTAAEVDKFLARYGELLDLLHSLNDSAAADEPQPAKSKSTRARSTAPKDVEAALDDWRSSTKNDEERAQIDQAFVDLIDSICKGSPTREQIEALGSRARTRFLAWLLDELVDPKGRTSGTAPSLRTVG